MQKSRYMIRGLRAISQKRGACCSSSSARTVGSGGPQAPNSQYAFKRTFEGQTEPIRLCADFSHFRVPGCGEDYCRHAPFRRSVLQLDCPVRLHNHMCTWSISSLAVGNQDIFKNAWLSSGKATDTLEVGSTQRSGSWSQLSSPRTSSELWSGFL